MLATIIVLYHPDPSVVPFVERLQQAGNKVVLVANAIDDRTLAALRRLAPLGLILNEGNLGLADGLNQGLSYAFEHGASHALLLDQDSRPAADMGPTLLDIFRRGEGSGGRIGCIGPQLVDRKRPDAAVQRVTGGQELVDVVTIITSGSVLSKDAFAALGPMWSALFIDGIDHEWCFRATSQGWRVCVAANVVMEHDMGDAGVSVFGRYKPCQRRPFRHYHLVRNTLWLLREQHIPLGWRVSEGAKLLYRIPFYLAVSTDRPASLKSIVRAIGHGLLPARARPTS